MPPSQLSWWTGISVAAVKGWTYASPTAASVASPRVTIVRAYELAGHAASTLTAASNTGSRQERSVPVPGQRAGRYSPARFSATTRMGSATQDRTDLQFRLGRGDFLAAVPADALHLDEAALAMDHDIGAVSRHDLADLFALHLGEGAGDALRALEQEQLLAVERGPGAGRRIAAANEVVGEVDVRGPVDVGFGIADDAFVAGVGFVLLMCFGGAGDDLVGGLQQAGDARREHLVEVEGAERVVVLDRDGLRQDDRALVQTVGGAEYGKTGFLAAEDDRPAHGRGAAVQRQQAGMELDGAESRDLAQGLRHELGHEGHDADLDVGLPHRVQRGEVGQFGELMHCQPALLGGEAQRVGTAFLGGAEHGGDLIPAVQEGLHRGFAEILLADNGDAHVVLRC